mgnify:CR=1 FL=1
MTPAEHLSAIRDALTEADDAVMELQTFVAISHVPSEAARRAIVGEAVRTTHALDQLVSRPGGGGLSMTFEAESTPEDIIATGTLAERFDGLPYDLAGCLTGRAAAVAVCAERAVAADVDLVTVTMALWSISGDLRLLGTILERVTLADVAEAA